MKLFNPFKKKAKPGNSSKIDKLRSPYLKKPVIGFRPAKRLKNKKPVFEAPRLKPPSNRAKKFFAIVLTFGILSFVIYALFFSDYFNINKYQVEEEGIVIDTNLEINRILDGIQRKNLIMLDEQSIKESIFKDHPEIKSVQIKKILPKTIKVIIQKYPTVANIVNTAAGIQKKFLVNSQGLLIEENNENPDLPYIKMETKELLKINNPILEEEKRSTERLNYILSAISLFEEKFGIRILFTVLKTRERELHIYTEKYFYVMLDMEKGAPDVLKGLNDQLEKLKKSLPKLDIYKEPLLYIDLRISGTDNEKVIFKRKK